MIAYQTQMLPQVNYQKMGKNFPFPLVELEYSTMQDCCDFLKILKSALIKEHLVQIPELLIANLCAYLGTMVTVHTVHQAEKLEPLIINLIKHQALAAYQHFNQYPINNTISSNKQKKKNVEMLRESTPGSIIVQTMRLARVMMDMLKELKDHQEDHFKSLYPPKQTELFCSQETLIKIMLLVSSEKCAKWRDRLEGVSDHYIINQLAIQIGWLIGYFSHLDIRSPEETQYFDYSLPIIQLYRKHVYQLMHAYASAKQTQEEVELPENPEDLLNEIHSLLEKAQAQRPPIINDFQKQISVAQARIEKTLIELVMQKYSIKIMLMSLFYFWFTLEAPLYAADLGAVEGEDVFLHMSVIIDLIKKTVRSLPNQIRAPEVEALNEKMQILKSYLPDPEILDKTLPENIKEQTIHINTSIHTLISECINQSFHLEAITIALFSQWMRLSVFFGISESEWQKMDHYFPDILIAVRKHLHSIGISEMTR